MIMGPDAVKRHPMEHNCMSLETVVFTFFIKTQVAARNLKHSSVTSFIDTHFILATAGCFPGQQSIILSVSWQHPCSSPSAALFLCLPSASDPYSPTHWWRIALKLYKQEATLAGIRDEHYQQGVLWLVTLLTSLTPHKPKLETITSQKKPFADPCWRKQRQQKYLQSAHTAHRFDSLYYWMTHHQLTINTIHPACDTAAHLGLSLELRRQGWQEWERKSNCVSALLLPASTGCELQFLWSEISQEIPAVWNVPRELPTRKSSKQHWKPWLWLQ